MVSDFENRKQVIRERLLKVFGEISRAREGDEMVDLKDKAKGIYRVLETASTGATLERVESGVHSLELDLNRVVMTYR